MLWWILGGVGAIVLLIVTFVVWRLIVFARGCTARDERIRKQLAPVIDALQRNEALAPSDINRLAADPMTRKMLHELLDEAGQADQFPASFTNEQSQGEGMLVYWMMHPNEYQDPPAKIEWVKTCPRTIDGVDCRFHVYRLQMPAGHWADDPWYFGLAGPFRDGDPPFGGAAGAFSPAYDVEVATEPDGLVDWYIETCRNRGMRLV